MISHKFSLFFCFGVSSMQTSSHTDVGPTCAAAGGCRLAVPRETPTAIALALYTVFGSIICLESSPKRQRAQGARAW